jgi:4-hydroxy-tetrahydrodipicolinate reductase
MEQRKNGKIRVAVSGALGRMGSLTCSTISADAECLLCAMVDPALEGRTEPVRESGGEGTAVALWTNLGEALGCGDIDVVVDFSIPAAVLGNVLACVRRRVPVVVGTTGLSPNDLAEVEREVEEYGTPVLVVPNFAMGAVLMMQFAREAAAHFDACEIVELHHAGKVDAPSGTSRLTRLRLEETWRERGLEKEAPIHSVRLPGLVAHQEVIFGAPGETLTIRHDSLSRESFMPGVLMAVKRVRALQGLVVGLENIL